MKQGHYHFSVKNFSRGNSAPATAKAAYRSGEKITDERTGQPFNYRSRKESIVDSLILAPQEAPEWAFIRSEIWNEVEADPRKNLRFAKEIEANLPRSLDWETNMTMTKEFVLKNVIPLGVVADVCFHSKRASDEKENSHVHIMMTTRKITPDGFGEKVLELNEKSLLNQWRKAWADHVNGYFEKAGINERIDHRSLKDQGVDRLPQPKVGVAAFNMEKKGIQTERGDMLRNVQAANIIYNYAKSVEPDHIREYMDKLAEIDDETERIERRQPDQESYHAT